MFVFNERILKLIVQGLLLGTLTSKIKKAAVYTMQKTGYDNDA